VSRQLDYKKTKSVLLDNPINEIDKFNIFKLIKIKPLNSASNRNILVAIRTFAVLIINTALAHKPKHKPV